MARSTYAAVFLAALMVTCTLATAVTTRTGPEMPSLQGAEHWPDAIAGKMAGSSVHMVLRLQAGTFDPLVDVAPSRCGLAGAASPGVYLVQFANPLSQREGAALAAIGARVLGFVPDGGLVVAFPRPSAVLAAAALPNVRWVGPWQLGWKVHGALEGVEGKLDLAVVTWSAADDVSAALVAAGTAVEGHLLDVWYIRADASRLRAIAAIPDVCWVEQRTPIGFDLDQVARSIGARQATDGPYDTEGTAVWSYDPAVLGFPGVNGSSVIIDVTDTGVDGTHAGLPFSKRKAWYAVNTTAVPLWSDPVGHGTHVAGIAVGTGEYRTSETDPTLVRGTYAGVAPGANLIAQSLYAGSYWYKNLTKWSVQHGAEVSQNSWGRFVESLWGNYTLDSREFDNATRDADWEVAGDQPILVVFSAGNDGLQGNNTIHTTATGKNIITVGATGNGKQFLDPLEMWDGSSRGPTDDGRIKPDLVAPGFYVVSTFGIADTGASGTIPGDGGTHSYIAYTGTSMAAPVVSGAAALVIDHLRTVEGHASPSPALVKAVLIATADHLPSDSWPGKAQGWGRVNVSRALVETRTQTLEWLDQSSNLTAPGEEMDYSFDVDTGSPLTVSLVWTDVSASNYVGKTLVNDIDLKVTSPSGKVYLGNVIQDNVSVEGGSADRVNTVEVVHVPSPEKGAWQVTVSAHELPPVQGGGSQDFAIAVSGQVNKRFIDLLAQNLSVGATDAAEGEVVPIRFDITNTGNIPAEIVAWRLELLDGNGALLDTIRAGTVPSIGPGASERLTAEWTAVRGSYTLRVVPNPFGHIREETYQNNNASKSFFIKGYGVDAIIPVPISSGPPDNEVVYDINITNTGNTRDLIMLEREEPQQGWSARLERTFIDLQAGRGSTVKLFVGIPPDAFADSIARVNVSVWSQGNETYRVELSTQTQVLPMRSITVQLTPRQVPAAPGDTASFNFTIRNLGNGPDTLRVSVVQDAGPTDGVTIDVPRTTFSIEHGGTVEGTFTIALDASKVETLTVGTAIAFSVRVFSVNDPTAGAMETGAVQVEQLHAIVLYDPLPEGIVVPPGQGTSVEVSFLNQGNGAEQVNVDMVTPAGWRWDASPSVFSMDVGGTGVIDLNITSASSAEGRLHNLTLRLLDGSGGVLLELTVPVEVEWVQGLRVVADGETSGNVTRGSEIAFKFYVTNTGNRPDRVTVEFRGLTAGLLANAEPAQFDLPVQQRVLVQLVFNATADAQLLQGTYEIYFRYAQDVRWEIAEVEITIEQAPPSNGGDGGGDDGGGGIPVLPIAALVVVLVVIVALLLVLRRRSRGKRDEELFFAGGGASMERTVSPPEYGVGPEPRRRPLPPPPPPPPDLGEPPVPMPVHGGAPRCPACGSGMEALGAGTPGFYCPMCGKQVGTDGSK